MSGNEAFNLTLPCRQAFTGGSAPEATAAKVSVSIRYSISGSAAWDETITAGYFPEDRGDTFVDGLSIVEWRA